MVEDGERTRAADLGLGAVGTEIRGGVWDELSESGPGLAEAASGNRREWTPADNYCI